MHLAPVIAQLVTLALSDRLEGRYILNEQVRYFEASNTTTPGALVRMDWRRASLTVGYLPTMQIVPLQKTPRFVILYHHALLSGEYRWRRTTLTLSENVGFGERDFRREALAYGGPNNALAAAQTPQPKPQPAEDGAAPPKGTTTGGTKAPATGGTTTPGNQTATDNRPAEAQGPQPYGEFRTSAALDHRISKALSLRFSGGYSINGGLGRVAQRSYPLSRGPDGLASVSYTLDPRNIFTSSVTGQLVYSEDGGHSFITTMWEDYTHRLTRQTTLSAGIGVSFSRAAPPGGLPLYSIYPTGRAGMTHNERVARGNLTLSIGFATSPALDLRTGAIDPRVGGAVSTGWARDRFSVNATTSSSISIARGDVNAFSAIYGSLSTGYQLGAGFALDGGVRATWERYLGKNLIEPSLVFFSALTWGVSHVVNPPHPGAI